MHVVLAAWILVVLVAASTAAVVVDDGTDDDRLGVYRGAAAPDEVRRFERWLGRSTPWALDFLAADSWRAIAEPAWWAERWAATDYQVVYSVPLLPEDEGSIADGASGGYNAHFRRLAEVLVEHDQADAVLRLGWEFNGTWYRWAAGRDPAAFARYWRQVVDTMRAVPGAAFHFDWCPTSGGSEFPLEQAWPGDSYVDYVGLDVYDQAWHEGWEDPVRRWESLRDGRYGLRWHRDFAAAHGKRLSFPEWGLAEREDGHGGGDNPLFVERMHAWIDANDVAYHAYFDFDAPDGRHRLSDGQFPQAGSRFKVLFGDGQA